VAWVTLPTFALRVKTSVVHYVTTVAEMVTATKEHSHVQQIARPVTKIVGLFATITALLNIHLHELIPV